MHTHVYTYIHIYTHVLCFMGASILITGVFHCSCSSSEVLPSQLTVSMVAEMIHIASLAHDDVIDGATVRRGKPSVNAKWGVKMVRLAPCIRLACCVHVSHIVPYNIPAHDL